MILKKLFHMPKILLLFTVLLLSGCTSDPDAFESSYVSVESSSTPTDTPTHEPTPAITPTSEPTAAPSATEMPALESTAEPVSTDMPETTVTPMPAAALTRDYVLNTSTKKFHLPTCTSVKDIKAENRKDVNDTRENIISQGYDPCGRCHP